MLSSKQLDNLIRAWPDENGVSSDPETYAAWIRAQREHAGKFIGMRAGQKALRKPYPKNNLSSFTTFIKSSLKSALFRKSAMMK